MRPLDRDLERHRTWLGFAQQVGLVVSPVALIRAQAVPERNVAELRQTLITLAGDSENPRLDFRTLAERVFGWEPADLAEPTEEQALALLEYQEVLRPTWVVSVEPDSLLVQIVHGDFDALPAERGQGWHASAQARFERLLRETKASAGILYNERSFRLVYAPPGETSGHITFNLKDLCSPAGGELLAALQMLLSASRVFSAPQGRGLFDILRASRRFQAEVSTALSEQVLDALWELLRGFEAADAGEGGHFLRELARDEPSAVYGGLLTVILRLVFLLYSEHRGLMPDDPLYVSSYSIGALYDRLRNDAARNPDTMEHRFGGWAALLALFRLVHRGGAFGLPARHGELFDPQRYAFLEGATTPRDTVERFEAPRVPDGCVHRVLDRLLVLDGERLSYRSLDVEQIGSVYEALMGFTVSSFPGPAIAVKPNDVVVDLERLLRERERTKALQQLSGCKLTDRSAAALRAAPDVPAAVAAIGNKVSRRTRAAIAPGGLFLQPTGERKQSDSHYTPRELTAPIVKTTLAPILRALGERPTAEQILSLRICDPAMGSGAFLVETCRQLAEALMEAWERHRNMPRIPADEEPRLYARRLVVQRCLYGVDRNPFAVSLAKVSLWLVTLAKEHAFTFIDHALKQGDSLVGFTREQIARFHWAPRRDDGPLFAALTDEARTEGALARARIAAADDEHEGLKRLAFNEARDAIADAQLAGDLLAMAFFAADSDRGRDNQRILLRGRLENGEQVALRQLAQEARESNPPLASFHWEIEFPEVFDRENPGFDAFVGNPPFAGKNAIADANPGGYIEWLKKVHEDSHGNADLSAHFFRRAFNLLRNAGTFGLIATNTIAQGDTRSTGLRFICTHGGNIYEAKKRYRWPLPGAAVVVSVVHVIKGDWTGQRLLDGHPVERVSAFLFHRGGDEDPESLRANANKSFQGVTVLGMGFTFDDTDKSGEANPLSEMRRLIEKDPLNSVRIFPYAGGEEINDSPTHTPHRYVINFGDMTEKEAREGWPDLLVIVEAKVKGTRGSHSTAPWWQFERPRFDLAAAIKESQTSEVLAIARNSATGAFTFVPSNVVLSEKVVVFPSSDRALFGLLQSRVHEIWARMFSTTFKDDLQYTPSKCLETYPFPLDRTALRGAGATYFEARAAYMKDSGEGLTDAYGRFNSPDETHPEILRLRQLHDAIDRAVLDAYGWSDIPNRCVFELEYEIDEDEYENRKKPWCYRWPAEVRDEVLSRLLELNRERAAEERRLAPPERPRRGRRGPPPGGPRLF